MNAIVNEIRKEHPRKEQQKMPIKKYTPYIIPTDETYVEHEYTAETMRQEIDGIIVIFTESLTSIIKNHSEIISNKKSRDIALDGLSQLLKEIGGIVNE
jgi:hypothetical protein